MALATQCPHCQTIFKVAHDQLKLRSGLVRCGACKQIFNGIEHLVPPDQGTPGSTPPESAAVSAPPLPQALPAAAIDTEITPDSMVSNAFQAEAQTGIDALEFIPVDDPETQTRIFSPAPPPQPDARPSAASSAVAEADEDPLTRMTLVDFSDFNAEWDETVPAHDATPPPSAGQDNQIWPDTPEDLPGQQHAAVEEWPDDAIVDAFSADTLAAAVSAGEPESKSGTGAEENAPLSDQALIDAMPQPFATAIAPEIEEEGNGWHAVTPATVADEDAGKEEDSEEPTFVTSARRRQRWRRVGRIFMVLASTLLLAALLAQGAYIFRDQLAAWFPQSKPALSSLCELAGCQVGLPAQIEQVSIESNQLQAQANNRNVFTLSLLLHNRSAVAQAWPHIELTLNDANGKAIVRRALAPGEYLPAGKDPSRGIAARSEQAVNVSFELSQLQASDYRVYLFYP